MKCVLPLFLVVFNILQTLPSAAQTVISGKVTDIYGNPVQDVHIMLQRPGSASVIGFDITRKDGKFSITLNVSLDSLMLRASSIAHEEFVQKLSNRSQSLDIRLQPSTKELKGITVKAARVVRKGDTLSYLVEPYARKQDRTISDVLRRMPGIEVENTGRILFEGKPISGVYVEGKDLMEQQYGILTNNLPYEKVASVEVIDNFEPTKILSKYSNSDKVILNFRLKKEITLTGNAEVSGGAPLVRYGVNIVPILFQPGLQSLLGIQANNTGKMYLSSQPTLTIPTSRYDEPEELFAPSPRGLPNVNIAPDLYVDNHSAKFTGNVLTKVSANWDLRLNYLYSVDKTDHQWDNLRQYFLSADTLTFLETNAYRKKYSLNTLTVNLKHNTEKYYSDNRCEVSLYNNRQTGLHSKNGLLYKENYESRPQNFLWSTRYIFPARDRPFELYTYINYDNMPDLYYSISPFNFLQNILTDSLKQSYSAGRWSLEAYFAYYGKWSEFTFKVLGGISYQNYSLTSCIDPYNTEVKNYFGDSLLNNKLTLNHLRNYYVPEVTYRTTSSRLALSVPFNLLLRDLNNVYITNQQTTSDFFTEPRISYYYELSATFKVFTSLKRNYRLYDISEFYTGYILRNPDYFVRNITSPATMIYPVNTLSLDLKYYDLNTGLSSQLTGSYALYELSHIISDSIGKDGMHHHLIKEMKNNKRIGLLRFNMGKSIPEAHLNFKLLLTGQSSWYKYFINHQFAEGMNRLLTVKPSVIFNSSLFDITWSVSWQTISTKSGIGNATANVNFYNQEVSVFKDFGHLGKGSVSLQHYHLKPEDYFLLQLNYRYRIYQIRRYNVETGIILSNLLSEKSYAIVNLSTYLRSSTTIPLRETQGMVFLRFNY
ncbi:MAG: carboxypeptidase regulatory-like domain-containing protein [Bacteroidales bacterium]|nr:carboxypeptidase regulatory-like domain-containing protein [Bacteroidales bacterium]